MPDTLVNTEYPGWTWTGTGYTGYISPRYTYASDNTYVTAPVYYTVTTESREFPDPAQPAHTSDREVDGGSNRVGWIGGCGEWECHGCPPYYNPRTQAIIANDDVELRNLFPNVLYDCYACGEVARIGDDCPTCGYNPRRNATRT